MIKPRNQYRRQSSAQCCAILKHVWPQTQCSLGGRWEHEGKLYCHLHHPPAAEFRLESHRLKAETKLQDYRKDRMAQRLEQDLRTAALAYCESAVPEMVQQWRASILTRMLGPGSIRVTGTGPGPETSTGDDTGGGTR